MNRRARGSGFRPIQLDVNPRLLQRAHDTGLAVQDKNRAIEQTALGVDADNPMLALVEQIKRNTDIDIALKVLKLGYVSRVINLTANVPAQIIEQSKYPRGYIIINPAETVGFSSTVTFYASLLRANGFVTPSTNFNVSGVDTVRCFLDVTAITNTPTLTIDAQTQDPLTSNWATSQVDIFGSAATVGTYYAQIGTLGVDRQIRLKATVGNAAGDDITFSVSGILKGGALTPTGSTVYVGGDANVSTGFGYPILPGQREYFWLWDNVQMFAISPTEPMTIKVFQLQ